MTTFNYWAKDRQMSTHAHAPSGLGTVYLTCKQKGTVLAEPLQNPRTSITVRMASYFRLYVPVVFGVVCDFVYARCGCDCISYLERFVARK